VERSGAEVMGTVPADRPGTGVDKRVGAGEGTGAATQVRTLVRVPREGSPALFERLREVQQQRSSRKLPLVRISVNPPELF